MIPKNPMQLKALFKKIAQENRISAQLVMQNYMMERLLERISLSEFRDNFILKGGFLISSMIGLHNRTTMDIDATITGLTLEKQTLQSMFDTLCHMRIDDIFFKILNFTEIREADSYPGFRIHLMANYQILQVPLTVDITTGDRIIPESIEYSYNLLFEQRSISVLAYNLESILAEKLETILVRNIANTRLRDFYDVYILYKLRRNACRTKILRIALFETAKRRGSEQLLVHYQTIIENLSSDTGLQGQWLDYQRKFAYAQDITFIGICDSILELLHQTFLD